MPTNSPTAHEPSRPPFEVGPSSAVAERGLKPGPRSSGTGLIVYVGALALALAALAAFAAPASAAETLIYDPNLSINDGGFFTADDDGSPSRSGYGNLFMFDSETTINLIRWGQGRSGSDISQYSGETFQVLIYASNSSGDEGALVYEGDEKAINSDLLPCIDSGTPYPTNPTSCIRDTPDSGEPTYGSYYSIPETFTFESGEYYLVMLRYNGDETNPTSTYLQQFFKSSYSPSAPIRATAFAVNADDSVSPAPGSRLTLMQLWMDDSIEPPPSGIDTSYTNVVNTGPVPEGTDPFTQYASLEGTTQVFSGYYNITQEDYDNEYGPTIDEIWVYLQNMDVDNRIETFKVGDVEAAGESEFSFEKTGLLDDTTYRYFYYFVSSEDPSTTYHYNGIRYTFTIGENAQAAALGLTDLDDRMGLATSTCTVLNPTGCVQNAAVFLFWPSGTSLAQFQTLSLKDRFPFSYIYQFGAIKDALYGNADMAPAAISVNLAGFGELTFLSRDMVAAVPFAALIKEMLSAVLWFLLAYALYRAVIRSHDTQTHV